MKCPNCRFSNPDGAKFCMNCGTNLQSIKCANCGTELPTGARFCFECGQPTPAHLAADRQRHEQLATGTPGELSHKMRSSAQSAGERRVVTSLFADVVGSTALAEQMDPEEWLAIMNGAFQHITKTIYTYEGTIARLMGDALLAFFGAPVSHEDDPERAVRAGLDLIDEVGRYAKEVKATHGIEFQMRVGINTGKVVVGAVGSDLIYEYTAMGDAINLAARMEQTAQPGTVQISEHTYKSVAPLFDVEPLGPIKVKGKREPVNAYSVIGRKATPGRLRGIEGLYSPLVGRVKEFEAIKRTVAETLNGRGQIVAIVGEAGIGKSRLIEELLGEWRARTGRSNGHIQYRGVSYESERPYGMFRRSLIESFQVGEDESGEAILAHIAAQSEPAARENASYGKLVLAVKALLRMESDEDELGEARYEGEELKKVIYEGIVSPMRYQLQEMPALYVFDDLHWADPASVELGEYMLGLADEYPALILLATRPERRAAGWRLIQAAEREYGHRYSSFTLSPLADEDAGSLIANLLAVSEMPPAIQAMIQQRAEGNPFFIEEVIRSLIESGAIVQEHGGARWLADQESIDIHIPENVNSLLTARIDRLEPEARRTLQLASVIGRRFSTTLLETLLENRALLRQHLNAFERHGLVLPADGGEAYSFRHDLTQEAAYNSILRHQRPALHRSVGEAIENLYPNQLIDQAPVLVRHFREAADDSRGRKYALLAGDESARVHATTEAISFYREALEYGRKLALHLAEQWPVYEKLGRSLELAARYEDAYLLYDELNHLAVENNEDEILLSAMLAKATLRVIANTYYDPAEGKRLLEEANVLADKLGDQRGRVKMLWQLMLLDLSTDMDVEARLRYGEEALALARQLGMDELLPFILHDLWYAYGGSGQWDIAIEALEEACVLWRESGNDPMLSESMLRLSISYQSRGDFETAIKYADEAFQYALKSDNTDQKSISRSLIGEVYIERGEFGRAIEIMEETIAYGIPITNVTTCIATRCDLAILYLELGRPDKALALIDAADEVAGEFFLLRPWQQAARVEYLLLTGDHEAAFEAADQMISSSEQKKRLGSMTPLWIRPGLAHTKVALARDAPERAIKVVDTLIDELRSEDLHLFLAEALYLKGVASLGSPGFSPEQSRDLLLSAREEAERFHINRILWRVLLVLGELEERTGDPGAAKEYRLKASETLKFIVDQIDQAELRESFVRTEAARSLLAGTES